MNGIGYGRARSPSHHPPVSFDAEGVSKEAGRAGTAPKINSFPSRLGSDGALVRLAFGSRAVFLSDGHAIRQFVRVRDRVVDMQRGWLPPERTLNVWRSDKRRCSQRRGRSR